MHSSQKKSSGWEPSYFQPWGPPALPSQKKGKKQTNRSCSATISCGSSFLALSLLPPSATCSQSLTFPLQELGWGGKNREALIFGMFLILCASPSFLGPGLLLPIRAPSEAVLKGCHWVMGNRLCLGRLPPLPPPVSLPREPFPARHVQILCLLTVRPSSGVKPQSWSGRGSFSCIGTPFDGQLYLLWNERGTEQCSPCLLPLYAVSLEAWRWPAGLSTRL